MIEGGIVVFVFISFYWLTVELCACSIVYYDCQCELICLFGSFYW